MSGAFEGTSADFKGVQGVLEASYGVPKSFRGLKKLQNRFQWVLEALQSLFRRV